jgi:hypothetical protein
MKIAQIRLYKEYVDSGMFDDRQLTLIKHALEMGLDIQEIIDSEDSASRIAYLTELLKNGVNVKYYMDAPASTMKTMEDVEIYIKINFNPKRASLEFASSYVDSLNNELQDLFRCIGCEGMYKYIANSRQFYKGYLVRINNASTSETTSEFS